MIQAKPYDLKLAVRNLEESVEFYRRVFSWLGFTRSRLWDDPYDKRKTYTLGNDHMYLELVEDEHGGAPERPRAEGIAGPRFEFAAGSKEEVDAFHRHLVANGVRVVDGPRRFFDDVWKAEGMDGVVWYAVYFVDTNGMKFGLVYTNDW